MGGDQCALMWVRVPKSCPSGSTTGTPAPPGSGESPAAGELPKTGMGRDARGLSSLPWAGLNPSAGPGSLEQMAEIPEDTAPLEPMGRGDGDAASAMGAPTGSPLLYRGPAHGKRLSPSQMAATCHPSTQCHLPRAEQPAEGTEFMFPPKAILLTQRG